MPIGVQFSPGWYALFVAFFLAWLMLTLFRRKGVERKEAKEQFVLGLLGSCALVSMEIFATSTNLWTYVPQNWPVMLWPTYFVAILFGYQLLRLVEGFFSKNTPAR
jgi:fatty acid desaturase